MDSESQQAIGEARHYGNEDELIFSICKGCKAKDNEIEYLRKLNENLNERLYRKLGLVNSVENNFNKNESNKQDIHKKENFQPITGPIKSPSQLRRALAVADNQFNRNKQSAAARTMIDDIETGKVVPLVDNQVTHIDKQIEVND